MPPEAAEKHNYTIDRFIGEIIGKVWLKRFEVRNLDYETFHKGEEPQQVFIEVVIQDPNDPSEDLEYEASGAYIGEALAMVLEEIRMRFA